MTVSPCVYYFYRFANDDGHTFVGDPNEDDDDEDDDHGDDDDDNDDEGDDIAQSVVNTPIYNIIPGVIAVVYCC